MSDLQWRCLAFTELNVDQLYTLLKLRINIFVVEQNCPYPDLDDKDRLPETLHLLGYLNDEMVAYARILPANSRFSAPSIGRVVIAESARRQGLGENLMRQALDLCQQRWPGQAPHISAQLQWTNFYQGLGFYPEGEPYLEDDIPHIHMIYAS